MMSFRLLFNRNKKMRLTMSGRTLLVLWALSAAFAWHSSAQLPISMVSPNEHVLGRFGSSVDRVPDVNNDDIDDIVVGAATENNDAATLTTGRAYILDGSNGSVLHELSSSHEENSINFGGAVAGLDDVNNDGFGDVAIGAWGEEAGSVFRGGRVYIFSGATGAPLREVISPNNTELGFFGKSLAAIEDINADGFGDFVVGAPLEFVVPEPDDVGRVYIFSGDDGALIQTLETSDTTQFGEFGTAVGVVPDVDGDNLDDVIVGAPGEKPDVVSTQVGRAHLFSSATGAFLRSVDTPNPEQEGHFGLSVAGVEDINSDGIGDILVGAGEESLNEMGDAGRAYVFSGADGSLLWPLASPNAEEGGAFGFSVAGIPDINDDGISDVAVGAPMETDDVLYQNAGRCYFFSGASGGFLGGMISPRPEVTGQFGHALSKMHNAAGAGKPGILVGAYEEGYSFGFADAGRAHLMALEVDRPSVSITSSAAPATNVAPIPFEATFSEPVFGLDSTDLVIVGGALDSFSGAEGSSVYTFTVQPNTERTVWVGFPEGAAENAVGVLTLQSSPFGVTYDITPPGIILRAPDPGTTTTGPVEYQVQYEGAPIRWPVVKE